MTLVLLACLTVFFFFLDKSPIEKISAGDRVDHGNLKRVIDYSYFNSRTKYNIEEESPCSHGRADIIFRPKKKIKEMEKL
jgi:hypothetical protein